MLWIISPDFQLYEYQPSTEDQSSNMLSRFGNHKCKTEEEGFYLKNGALMLQQLIQTFNGNCNPIRTYTMKELTVATNEFHSDKIIHEGWNCRMYEGLHEEHEILVKKFEARSNMSVDPHELIANEISIASYISNHKNVLKLLGCGLETELPSLVYEFPAKGNLAQYIYGINGQSLPWQVKLSVVVQVADAVSYLHYCWPKMILHRHITCENIYLDQDCVAKLSEFQSSTPVPSGKSHVDFQIMETDGRLADPNNTVSISGCTDVYIFGIFLFEILAGQRWSTLQHRNLKVFNDDSSSSNNELELANTYLEANNLGEESKKQVIECSKLVHMCLKTNPDDRPTMTEVARALRSIRTLGK